MIRTAVVVFVATVVFGPMSFAGNPPVTTPHPVLFVTQVPIPADFTTIGSTFGNHEAWMQDVGRGGDLWIRYPDGTLKNLTSAAGFGNAGFQGVSSIAVRDPCVHWSGTKAIFSMVVGAPPQQYQWTLDYWQLYEVTGLGLNDAPVISKVPYQPAQRNNVAPIYGTDDRILFTSDRPRTNADHLYPPLDEYEEAPAVAGLYRLDPVIGDLSIVTHSPSGDFSPMIDSFGRLLFTRWDHLQRDQQADADNASSSSVYGTFNWSSEEAQSVPLMNNDEVFPEPRPNSPSLPQGSNVEGHTFNHFFPWMAHEDGSGLETLNHVGRHELHSYFNRSFNDDSNLVEFIASVSGSANPNRILNFLNLTEDPTQPGRYLAIDAPEFYTHSAGGIVAMSLAPGQNPDALVVEYVTHPDTSGYTPNPSAEHSGLYREPLVLADGSLVAVHTDSTEADGNIGTGSNPKSKYAFRIKRVVGSGGYGVASTPLTSGITKSVNYWSPDVLISYSGELWELNPVEVRARPRPVLSPPTLPTPESNAFQDAGVDVGAFRAWLYQKGLSLLVSRDVTVRDDQDRQQPFNLQVPGGAVTTATGGKVYDVQWMQFYQGDQIRGIGGTQSPKSGRRVLAQPMHDALWNPPLPGGVPDGSVKIASDGSMAAIVPAQRALSWQLNAPSFDPVVRERYWLSFQPGEIRSCANCHGVNDKGQGGVSEPQNTPVALVDLLNAWKTHTEPPPSLSAAGAGTVGVGSGGPFDVLTINGSAGGNDRRVDVAAGAPITIAVAAPPGSTSPAKFLLFGLVGSPTALIEFETGIGSLLFPPTFYAPNLPGFFLVTDNLLSLPGALAPSVPAPWNLHLPGGLGGSFTFTMQGVIQDGGSLSVTNGVILRVL